MHDLSGQSLGRYHLIEKLGEGGMAVVYKAFDTRLECDAAVKIIRTDQIPSAAMAGALKRFEREAKSVAQLTHPNIVKVSDYGEDDGTPYLVMPYLPCGTLKEVIRKRGRMPWQEAFSLIYPIAHALDHAHNHGIVHRDIKPSNILLAENNQPLLADFGIAKILAPEETMDGLTATGAAIGTPEYMAPEQWENRPIDGRADIYALGVVLYEMITGRPPFKADTVPATMVQVLRDPLPRPTKFVPNLPDEIEKLLLKSLARDPQYRYGTMAEFVLAISSLLTNSQAIERKQIHQNKSLRWIIWVGLGSMGLVATILLVIKLIPSHPDGTPPIVETTPVVQSTIIEITATPEISPVSNYRVGDSIISAIDGAEMMFIPAGSFSMGISEDEVQLLLSYCPECYYEEIAEAKPIHTVSITNDYWMYKTEVSNAQYQMCVNAGTCSPPNYYNSKTREDYYGNSEYGNYPVVFVNWDQANTYCRWAGGRLPTEAEWEKAARGGDNRLYPWGNEPPTADLANIHYLYGDTTPVDAFQSGASPYGVLNMSGNVWEWVADWYQPGYYSTSPSTDPLNTMSNLEGFRSGRGGSFWINQGFSASVTRDWYEGYKSGYAVGFRCAMDAN